MIVEVAPIVFLDMDGVLNGHGFDEAAQSNRIDPRCVEALNLILDSSGARLVLSSAWRYMVTGGAMTLRGFEYMLRTHGAHCNGRLIGHTVPDEVIPTRGAQVSDWMARLGCNRRYLVLDDGGFDASGRWCDMGLNEAGHPVIWTDGRRGLSAAQAKVAVEYFKGGR
jgi:hypothetical protein